jgi:hypothetical protein
VQKNFLKSKFKDIRNARKTANSVNMNLSVDAIPEETPSARLMQGIHSKRKSTKKKALKRAYLTKKESSNICHTLRGKYPLS